MGVAAPGRTGGHRAPWSRGYEGWGGAEPPAAPPCTHPPHIWGELGGGEWESEVGATGGTGSWCGDGPSAVQSGTVALGDAGNRACGAPLGPAAPPRDSPARCRSRGSRWGPARDAEPRSGGSGAGGGTERGAGVPRGAWGGNCGTGTPVRRGQDPEGAGATGREPLGGTRTRVGPDSRGAGPPRGAGPACPPSPGAQRAPRPRQRRFVCGGT